jgi:micrococcal nuclease
MKRYFYLASLLKAVDGDTCDVRIDLGFNIYHNVRIRLFGVNTYETHGRKRKYQTAEQNKKADQAAALMSTLVELNPIIFVHTRKDRKGKYGRYLAILWVEKESLLKAWKQVFETPIPDLNDLTCIIEGVETVNYNRLLYHAQLAPLFMVSSEQEIN